MIPLSVPTLHGNEWHYIKSCLDTNWVSSAGEFVNRFEDEICEYTGSKHAISCVNGTAALHTALLVAGVKSDDEVIVPTLTFIAPVNTVHYVGASPVFMDCDEYFNIDVDKTLEFLNEHTIQKNGQCINKLTGRTISAIIPVHVFGNAVNLEPLLDACKKRNIIIIEDATESLGTYYTEGILKEKYTGTIGDIGCYSFNGNKIITTGGGGMIVTAISNYAKRAYYLTTQAKDDKTYFVHNSIGYNYRLTNIQAALGVAQLEKLEKFIEAKKSNYECYRKLIADIPGLSLRNMPSYARSNFWFYALEIDKKEYPLNRDQLIKYLQQHEIQVRPVWYLNHLQKPYLDYYTYKIENAITKINNTINLPCSSNLTKNDIEKVVSALSKPAIQMG